MISKRGAHEGETSGRGHLLLYIATPIAAASTAALAAGLGLLVREAVPRTILA